jgi:hypothetical protein
MTMLFPSLRAGAASATRAAARTFASSSGGGGTGGGGGMALPVALVALGGAGYVYYDTQQQLEALTARADALQISLSGKTNSAFVFIKPHACKGKPGEVEKVVEGKLKEAGIRILDKGEKLAEEIDRNMLIDTHYGAIASKAVKLKPSELNVPDKGKKEFLANFGETWEAAVAAGKVYNAKDGADKLGLTSEQLNDAWSKLSRGKDLIKFGGGFYCGKVKDIYIMNGFYMSMRAGEWERVPGCLPLDVRASFSNRRFRLASPRLPSWSSALHGTAVQCSMVWGSTGRQRGTKEYPSFTCCCFASPRFVLFSGAHH